MLLLLPPAERMADPSTCRHRGGPWRPGSLMAPELDPLRSRLVRALAAVGDPASLGVPVGLAERAAELNRAIPRAATLPAVDLYAGVLWQHLDVPRLSARARRRAESCVLVASALWGLLRGGDRVPAHRLGIAARLPGLGPLPALWRPALAPVLATVGGAGGGATGRHGGQVVDLRSSGYRAVAAGPPGTVVVEVRRGGRTAPSASAKQAKGLLTRGLLEAPSWRGGRALRSVLDAVLGAWPEPLADGVRLRLDGTVLHLDLPAGWSALARSPT